MLLCHINLYPMKISIQTLRHLGLLLLVLVLVGANQHGFSQSGRPVTGEVTDENGQTIPGVNVLAKGTSVGTITDIDGKFSITLPEESNVLVFSFIGFATREVAVGNSSSLNVTLSATLSDMEEVVVIGFGEQSRELLTTSVTKMDERVLENIPFANAASAMQGTLPGVRVQTTSGQPGPLPG